MGVSNIARRGDRHIMVKDLKLKQVQIGLGIHKNIMGNTFKIY